MTGLRLHEDTGLVALHALGTHPFALASLCIITEIVLVGMKPLFRRTEWLLPAHRDSQVHVPLCRIWGGRSNDNGSV